jgi:hypothetical protein
MNLSWEGGAENCNQHTSYRAAAPAWPGVWLRQGLHVAHIARLVPGPRIPTIGPHHCLGPRSRPTPRLRSVPCRAAAIASCWRSSASGGAPSHGRCSHSPAPPYSSVVVLHTKRTGRHEITVPPAARSVRLFYLDVPLATTVQRHAGARGGAAAPPLCRRRHVWSGSCCLALPRPLAREFSFLFPF